MTELEEFAKKLLKQLQKNLEKIRVQAIGVAKLQQTYQKQQTAQQQGQEAIESAKKVLENTSQTLETTIQGQFGAKVTEVFEKQQQTLTKLSS
ncbi:hypothetical protein ACSFB8_08545 [Enterococcus faecalis]